MDSYFDLSVPYGRRNVVLASAWLCTRYDLRASRWSAPSRVNLRFFGFQCIRRFTTTSRFTKVTPKRFLSAKIACLFFCAIHVQLCKRNETYWCKPVVNSHLHFPSTEVFGLCGSKINVFRRYSEDCPSLKLSVYIRSIAAKDTTRTRRRISCPFVSRHGQNITFPTMPSKIWFIRQWLWSRTSFRSVD